MRSQCPSCGKRALESESIYRCGACGDDFTGSLAALVIDSHTKSLRDHHAAEVKRLREQLDAANYNAGKAMRERDEAIMKLAKLGVPDPLTQSGEGGQG